ncbi:calcium-transporting ATPase 8, plasma membrane-type-like isoform X2 [Sorghum bicolor]|nr:calcium-transporting ATPase 8, plasma membrane-type-like isoform X1 [Sorghum bicolor]XP_021315080.1 calcium-transporting ATPase 8, plasma membrane-type-like isoform X2 [Sorghum bicolor]|eukprot:XP_021315074.1 calcium-transporting ATPase 8, plasma membrane-type-like isoform X1 [Sorghum bicolor]
MIGMDFKDVRSKSSVLHVLPFSSEKKRGGVVLKVSDTEVHIHWKGAAEVLLASCRSWLSTDGSVQPMNSIKTLGDAILVAFVASWELFTPRWRRVTGRVTGYVVLLLCRTFDVCFATMLDVSCWMLD